MAKIKVVVERDDNLFPRHIEITKGRKKLKIKQTPSPAGDVYSLEIEGRRDLLPSYPELFSIINARRIDRIGTIELIDLITEITSIGSVGNLDELTTIRDLTWSPKSLFQNPDFEQGFTGWYHEGVVEIEEKKELPNSLKFSASKAGGVGQAFPIPLDANWWTELYFMSEAGDIGAEVKVRYLHTDESVHTDTVTKAAPIAEKHVLTPLLTKKIKRFYIEHEASNAHDFSLYDLTTVF